MKESFHSNLLCNIINSVIVTTKPTNISPPTPVATPPQPPPLPRAKITASSSRIVTTRAKEATFIKIMMEYYQQKSLHP